MLFKQMERLSTYVCKFDFDSNCFVAIWILTVLLGHMQQEKTRRLITYQLPKSLQFFPQFFRIQINSDLLNDINYKIIEILLNKLVLSKIFP
jgi:hypothetical protein